MQSPYSNPIIFPNQSETSLNSLPLELFDYLVSFLNYPDGLLPLAKTCKDARNIILTKDQEGNLPLFTRHCICRSAEPALLKTPTLSFKYLAKISTLDPVFAASFEKLIYEWAASALSLKISNSPPFLSHKEKVTEELLGEIYRTTDVQDLAILIKKIDLLASSPDIAIRIKIVKRLAEIYPTSPSNCCRSTPECIFTFYQNRHGAIAPILERMSCDPHFYIRETAQSALDAQEALYYRNQADYDD